MGRKIQLLRGDKINLPILDIAEMALCTDTHEPFIGSNIGNIQLAKEADRLSDKADNATNVKAFGATGDGITNDTVAIQSAINASSIVYFPPGTYLCSGIVLPSNFKLLGAGIGATTLKLIPIPTSPLIDISGVTGNCKENISISDITLMHNTTFVRNGFAGVLLVGQYTRRILIENVEFKTFNAHAIYVRYTDDSTTMAQGWIIRGCIFRDGGTASTGIFLDSESEYNLVSNCTFHTITYAIKVTNAANNTILECIFLNCAGITADVSLANCGKLTVMGCLINHCTGYGIVINQSIVTKGEYGSIISGNEILYSPGALYLNGVIGVIVTGNRLINNSGSPITLKDNGAIVSDYNIINNNMSIVATLLNNTSTGTHNVITNNLESVPNT